MAFSFDEVNDYLTLGDDSRLDLPNGPWTMGGWVYLDDNSGSLYQYLLTRNYSGSNPKIYFYQFEDGAGGSGTRCIIRDSNGDEAVPTSLTIPSQQWAHILLTRDSSSFFDIWVDNSSGGNGVTNSSVGAIDPSANLWLGGRDDSNSDRFMGGDLAEWFKVNRYLNSSERQQLADGFSPLIVAPDADWYVPMIRTQQELMGNLSVGGSGYVVADHPPIIMPAPIFYSCPAAGGTEYTKALAGSLSMNGALTRKALKELAGQLEASGSLDTAAAFHQALAGAFDMSGGVKKASSIHMGGQLDMTADLRRRVNRALAGAFDFSGGVETQLTFVQDNAGSLDMDGVVAKRTSKQTAGQFDMTGAITKKSISKKLAGQFSMTGAAIKKTSTSLAGVLNMTGALASAITIGKSVAGVLSGWLGALAAVKNPEAPVATRLRKFINWFNTFGG